MWQEELAGRRSVWQQERVEQRLARMQPDVLPDICAKVRHHPAHPARAAARCQSVAILWPRLPTPPPRRRTRPCVTPPPRRLPPDVLGWACGQMRHGVEATRGCGCVDIY